MNYFKMVSNTLTSFIQVAAGCPYAREAPWNPTMEGATLNQDIMASAGGGDHPIQMERNRIKEHYIQKIIAVVYENEKNKLSSTITLAEVTSAFAHFKNIISILRPDHTGVISTVRL